MRNLDMQILKSGEMVLIQARSLPNGKLLDGRYAQVTIVPQNFDVPAHVRLTAYNGKTTISTSLYPDCDGIMVAGDHALVPVFRVVGKHPNTIEETILKIDLG